MPVFNRKRPQALCQSAYCRLYPPHLRSLHSFRLANHASCLGPSLVDTVLQHLSRTPTSDSRFLDFDFCTFFIYSCALDTFPSICAPKPRLSSYLSSNSTSPSALHLTRLSSFANSRQPLLVSYQISSGSPALFGFPLAPLNTTPGISRDICDRFQRPLRLLCRRDPHDLHATHHKPRFRRVFLALQPLAIVLAFWHQVCSVDRSVPYETPLVLSPYYAAFALLQFLLEA